MPCYFCETEPRESTFGYWCKECRELKNICNVYGFKRSLDILKKCCIRNEEQLEAKIENHKNSPANEIITRSKTAEIKSKSPYIGHRD